MKKIMFAAAVAAAGLAFGIESANTVGYTTLSPAQGAWTMVAVQFEDVGVATKNLLDYVKTSATPVTAANASSGATLMVYNGGGYNTYYYQSDAFNADLFDENFDWDAFEELAEEDEDAADAMYEAEASKAIYYSIGWADPNGDLVTSVSVGIGDSVWYYNSSEASTLTLAGEVNGTASFPLVCGTGLNMIANPYPADIPFSKLVFTSVEPAASQASAAVLMVMAGGGYNTYFYLADAFNADLFDENFDWDAFEELAEEDEDAADAMYEAEAGKAIYHAAGWADPNGDQVSGTFATIGNGFWLQLPTLSGTSETVTITAP